MHKIETPTIFQQDSIIGFANGIKGHINIDTPSVHSTHVYTMHYLGMLHMHCKIHLQRVRTPARTTNNYALGVDKTAE